MLKGQSLGTFMAIGSMTTPSSRHTATLSINGKMLIVGGSLGFNILATAELYDPDRQIFSGDDDDAALMPHRHAAPGRQSIVTRRSYGAGQSLTRTNRAQTYDPVTGTFAATGSMIIARQCHQANLLDKGKVLIADDSDLEGVGARHVWCPTYELLCRYAMFRRAPYRSRS